jgi:SAM-dependent methyltransferase
MPLKSTSSYHSFYRNEKKLQVLKPIIFQKIFPELCAGREDGMDNRKYYAAYDERYKTAHAHGVSWSSDVSTPIVMDVIRRYHIEPRQRLLEIGCGEGRDSRAVLGSGYPLLATDISGEAIGYCKKVMPQYESSFAILDCLSGKLDLRFDFIYAVAVVHMLVLDEDRNGFYQFVRSHLTEDGIALICTMGDGTFEMQSDISEAFAVQERNHESGTMMVAGTSCRMVSFDTFEKELARNGLRIMEKGITASFPDFNSLMYAVVRK